MGGAGTPTRGDAASPRAGGTPRTAAAAQTPELGGTSGPGTAEPSWVTKLAAHEAELGGTPAEREAAITRMQARQRGKLERKQTEERVGQGEMAGQKRSKKVAEQDVAAQRMQARVRGGADRKVVEERKAAGDLPGQPRLLDDDQGHTAAEQGVEAEAMAAAIAEADARAAAVMQARARGERDRKAVQARQQEGSLPGQQRQQQELQQETDEKVAVVRADVQQLKEAHLDLRPLAGAAAQQMLSPRMEQLLSPKGMQWVQQHMQTRCCGSRGKLPKNSKLPRLPLPGGALQGGSGLFGTPLLSSLMLEYGDWVQRYS